MEYRKLGRTGLSVSAIGLGCEGFIGLSEEDTRRQMDFAIAQGINFMDMYSSNPGYPRAGGQCVENTDASRLSGVYGRTGQCFPHSFYNPAGRAV